MSGQSSGEARQAPRRSQHLAGQDPELSPDALGRQIEEQRQQQRAARMEWIADLTDLPIPPADSDSADATDLDPPATPSWEEALDAWAKEDVEDPEEDREEASQIIRNWVQQGDARSTLSLASLGLTRLPDILPQDLTDLDIGDNKLTQLPDNLPQGLTTLNVYDNHLTRLPDTLPQALTELYVNGNRLTELPDTLPQNLTTLHVSDNQLTRLPDTLPQALTTLDVRDNQLTHLSQDLLQRLGSGLTIDADNNPLSEQARNDLAAAQNVPGDEDSEVSEPEPELGLGLDQGPPPELKDSAALWLAGDQDALDTWDGFKEEEGASEYSRFLKNLNDTPSASNPAYRQAVVNDLQQAAARPSLRRKYFLQAFGSSETCHDRVTLVWNAMQELRLSDDVERGDYDHRLDELISQARRMFRLAALDRIARDKSAQRQAALKAEGIPQSVINERVDEIEIYLAFQNKLRERLDLQAMVAPDMQYFTISHVKDHDLDKAEAQVRAEEATQFTAYLAAKWDPWEKVLARIAPEAYAAMQKELADALEEEFPDRLEQRMREMQLVGDDAVRILGRAVSEELAREIKGRLAQKVLQERNLAHLLD